VGVFDVYLLGGAVLLFGPAAVLHLATRGLPPGVGRIVAVVVGCASIAFAVVLWLRRDRVARISVPDRAMRPGSALALGCVMTMVDLPTAFPLFVVVGAIVHEDLPRAVEAGLLLVYCAAYVVPLAAIVVLRSIGGERGERWLQDLRARVIRWGPAALAVLSAVIGAALIAFGLLR
jgi:cytochrome c biogenesis protein CcdA